jgi:serine/threonine protein kinase/formylglycine-generating enzyme required for sulfatase activity
VDTQGDRVRAVFDRAVEIDSPAERQAFLDAECHGDAALRGEVEALLRALDAAGTFLGRPAVAAVGATSLLGPGPGMADDPFAFLQPSAAPGALGRLGHYEIQEVLGQGAFGIVFRAFDEKLHRVVAIKVLGPQLASHGTARERFLREARCAAAVRDEHVVNLHAVEETPIPYLVMEYVAGQTLQQKLDQVGPLGLQEVLRIGIQIAEGLAAAHRQGLVHRDVKPGNILLENGVERVKLTDFGLARAADAPSLTGTGIVAGTPMFMAPEQALCTTIDHRADLFSLGSVLYAMCTGQSPFPGPSTMAVLKRVCEETPRPIREVNPAVPEWLAAVVARLHAKKPQDRFASARELADLLVRRLAEVQSQGVAPPATLIQPAGGRRRWPWVAAAVVLAVGLGAAGLTVLVHLANLRPHADDTPGPHRDGVPAPGGAEKAPEPATLPLSAAAAAALQERWAAHLGVPVETPNSVGMKLRLIPPGDYWMTAKYRVRITKPYRIGTCEVTVGQFREFVRETNYRTDAEASGNGGLVMDRQRESIRKPEYTWLHPDVSQGDDYPIAQLSWHDAVEFCKWLSRKEKVTCRLPTEAEWEWACRAGTTTAYHFGDDAGALGEYGWSEENSGWKSHPVGRKRPNAWGLYDMHGNVCEYCHDHCDDDLPDGYRTDPQGPTRGSVRVVRSYSFADPAENLESTARAGMVPTGSMFHFGFRAVYELPE